MTKDNNIITLPGVKPPTEDQLNQHVIALLEKWLGDAKDGRLVAVAVCGVLTPNQDRVSAWDATGPYENALAASVMTLFNRYSRSLNDHND